MIIEYNKVREQVLSPVRANPSDAGLDVFFCPETPSAVEIAPGKNKLLQTGLRFGVPHGYMLQVMNRSGMAAKRCLIVGAHCIDSGYDGEVFIDMHNIGSTQQFVEPGTKIAQLVMVPVVAFRAVHAGSGDLYEWSPITISDRGDGGFGSTGA
jgi:deoxyuridine 5'-triphosphate nucleotidohydrolase